ncbi:HNH endonuclease [Acidisarcina polymorpha]|uniref:HNH endonuclease n=1 Tax=Acidisarcina polymorpha TaxID=2211140 RepID=UPI001F29552A|nr:hypothetical protein [Acidisarcina polymorpha]
MADFQPLPSASSLSVLPPGFPQPAGRILTSNQLPFVSRPARLELGREVGRSRQRVLFCRCGSSSIWSRGLCQRCYSRVRADERHFAGLRDRVLARDRHTCQGCQATSISTVLAVHHRQPGVSSLETFGHALPGLPCLDRTHPSALSRCARASPAALAGAPPGGERAAAALPMTGSALVSIAPPAPVTFDWLRAIVLAGVASPVFEAQLLAGLRRAGKVLGIDRRTALALEPGRLPGPAPRAGSLGFDD